MKNILLLALALTFPLYAAETPAEGDKPKEKETPKRDLATVFKKKDKDGDGFLTKDEFTAHAKDAGKAAEVFSHLDKNSDNKLSDTEFTDRGGKKDGKKGGKKHKAADKN